MPKNTVRTDVDALMELVRRNERVTIPDLAKELKITQETVQSWVDFLVEEKILGVEYKFTVPYVYLNESKKKADARKKERKQLSFDEIKESFYKSAREKEMPEEKIPELWKRHVASVLEPKRKMFLFNCMRNNLKNGAQLFEEYKAEVMER